MKGVTITLSTLLAVVVVTSVAVHPAFALQHFFNCITEVSNKDGGDHNLTEQQVIDCFEKEFPNNPGVGGVHVDHHVHSIITSGFNN